MLIGFLVRFISISAEPIARGGVIAKAFALFKDVLQSPVWSDVQIKLTVFQRPLVATDIDKAHEALVGNALQTLQQVVKDKDDAWVVAHVAQLQRLLEKTISSGDAGLLQHARPILEQLFRVVPDSPPSDEDADGDDDGENPTAAAAAERATRDDTSAFRQFADAVITESLAKQTQFHAAFVLLGAWGAHKPAIVSSSPIGRKSLIADVDLIHRSTHISADW